jgi:hypothetical protein
MRQQMKSRYFIRLSRVIRIAVVVLLIVLFGVGVAGDDYDVRNDKAYDSALETNYPAITLLSISSYSNRDGLTELNHKNKLHEHGYGDMKALLLTSLSFHNKQIYCAICGLQCTLIDHSAPEMNKTFISANLNSARFLKIAWIRKILNRRILARRPSQRYGETARPTDYVVYMDVDTVFTHLNCSLFANLVLENQRASIPLPLEERMGETLLRDRPVGSLLQSEYARICAADPIKQQSISRQHDNKISVPSKESEWILAMTLDGRQYQNELRTSSNKPLLQTGVMIISNDCRTRILFEYLWMLREGNEKYSMFKNNIFQFDRGRILGDMIKWNERRSTRVKHAVPDSLQRLNFNDVRNGFQSDQLALNIVVDTVFAMLPVNVSEACLDYVVLCPLLATFSTSSRQVALKILPRQIFNAFPHMHDQIWAALGNPQGDELGSQAGDTNGSAVVHFAGVYGGSYIETGQFDPVITILTMKEYVSRHIRFMRDALRHVSIALSSHVSRRPRKNQIFSRLLQKLRIEMPRFVSLEKYLESCVKSVFSDTDIEIANSKALACMDAAVQKLETVLPKTQVMHG